MSYAGLQRFFPECPGRVFAILRSVSGIPENRDSGAALPAARASSAESCRAILRDAEAALLPVIPRAQFLRRSDTWLPPGKTPSTILYPDAAARGIAKNEGKKAYAAFALAGMNS